MEIRRGVEADAAALTRLARVSKASWGYPDAWLREWEPELSISAEYIRHNAVFVAQDEGAEVVGVIALEDGPHGPEVSHLWVAPESQGLGLGRRLVECALEAARERRWSSLRILSDPHAQPFYERLGAVYVGQASAPVRGTDRTLPILRLEV